MKHPSLSSTVQLSVQVWKKKVEMMTMMMIDAERRHRRSVPELMEHPMRNRTFPQSSLPIYAVFSLLLCRRQNPLLLLLLLVMTMTMTQRQYWGRRVERPSSRRVSLT